MTRFAATPHTRLGFSPTVRLPPIALMFIFLVGLGLRFWALDGSSLWSDEGNTWALMQRSYGAIAQAAAADIHPPGYYWLLKTWTSLLGASAAGMRSFSALLGALLVPLVYAVAIRVGDRPNPRLGLVAAALAALNPFLIYYSQEARMYMLLALAGTGLFWALLGWMAAESPAGGMGSPRRVYPYAAAFIGCGVLGVWTHYSFPILLAAAGLAYLWHWRTLLGRRDFAIASLTGYVLANLVIVLFFLPWLSTAVRRVLNWPAGGVETGTGEGLWLTLRTLAFGPLRDLPEPLWPWLAAAGLLPVLGAVALARRRGGAALLLWLLAPVALMFGLGLFSDAFLKFLLTASPAWAVLAAGAMEWAPPGWARGLAAGLVVAGGAALAGVALPAYYTSPAVRDNYAGVADYVAATGDPATDLVVLDAPGQQDVWRYYDPGLPVLALPQTRPPDPEQTVASLAGAVEGRSRIFALFWATDEADPDRLVETWLDQHAFRGAESWQGNLRFVVYSRPHQLTCTDREPSVAFGDAMQLTALCRPPDPQTIPSGEMALLGLRWQSSAPLDIAYKVTVQLLDARNQVIAQHDAEPAGGSQPTDTWQAGEVITDNHGLPIPFGAPPGDYRLVLAVYDPDTGERLATEQGDHAELGRVQVARPSGMIPIDAIPIRRHTDVSLGPVRLAGYEQQRRGYNHAPDTPLAPGDLVHVTLLWQAPDPLPDEWPEDATVELHLGGERITAPLAGPIYPTGAWQPGEIVRGEFDIPYDGTDERLIVRVGEAETTLAPLPR